MKNRQDKKQIWVDIKFKERLERIKAKRLLNGHPVNNIGELTKKIMKCPSFAKLEEELILNKEIEKINKEIKSLIKFDKKIIK